MRTAPQLIHTVDYDKVEAFAVSKLSLNALLATESDRLKATLKATTLDALGSLRAARDADDDDDERGDGGARDNNNMLMDDANDLAAVDVKPTVMTDAGALFFVCLVVFIYTCMHALCAYVCTCFSSTCGKNLTRAADLLPQTPSRALRWRRRVSAFSAHRSYSSSAARSCERS